MLTITVPSIELFDDATQTFTTTKEVTITLEHSLISLSKWESRWKKPFLKENDTKTKEEVIDYIRCMTITQNVSDDTYFAIAVNSSICEEIQNYINDPMTATTFSNKNPHAAKSTQIVTSELIYYWMIQLNIPVEFQKWHLSRLLTLIKICEIKNASANGSKNMSKSAIRNRNRALNAQRKARLGTSG